MYVTHRIKVVNFSFHLVRGVGRVVMEVTETLHVLVVDDYENQFMFIKDILETVPSIQFHVDWASTFEAGQNGLKSGVYDVCLVDYDLGEHNGIELVNYGVRHGYETPMIVLTGVGSREIDMEAMRAGAADYIDKTNLKLAVLERAIRYAVMQSKAMNALRESEARQRVLMQTVPSGVFIIQGSKLQYVNPVFTRITGFTVDDIAQIGLRGLVEYVAPSHRNLVSSVLQLENRRDTISNIEFEATSKTGRQMWLNMATRIILLDSRPAVMGTLTDITRQVKAEQAEHNQRVFAEALLEISIILNRTLDFDSVLEHILLNVGKVVPHNMANIMIIEEEAAFVLTHHGYHEAEVIDDLLNAPYVLANTANLRYMLERRVPLIINDVHTSPMSSKLHSALGVQSSVGVPILISGQVIGFLNLDSLEQDFFTAQHINRLIVFAELAAVAIRNAQAFEVVQAEAAQEERQRLARDLHDAVSQTLFSANMIAETLPRLMERAPNEATQGLHQLARLTKGALAEMRTLLLELRPATLEKTDIRTLLQQLVSAFESRTQLVVDFQAETTPSLPTDVKLTFYRVAQEALNNIVKHARASQVMLRLVVATDLVSMMIQDDGCGFDSATISPARMGLAIMRERAEAIRADLTIISAETQGTQIDLVWESVP
jgi:PAS domain S-box-containing protein